MKGGIVGRSYRSPTGVDRLPIFSLPRFRRSKVRYRSDCATLLNPLKTSDVSFRVPVISGNKVQRSVPCKFPETFPHSGGSAMRGVGGSCIFVFLLCLPLLQQQPTTLLHSRPHSTQTADSRQQTATTKTTCLLQHPPLGGLWGPRSRLNLEMSRAAQPCLRW